MEKSFIEQMRESDREIKKSVPDADPAVLAFITDLTCCAAKDEDQYEVIRSTFRAGYCYYFAHLLKTAFGRGEVCVAAPFGHMVWVDDNGVPYDIEGVNFGEQVYNIPESYLSEEAIKDFKHIPGEEAKCTEISEVIEMIRRYEDDNNLPHQDLSYYHLEEKEKGGNK